MIERVRKRLRFASTEPLSAETVFYLLSSRRRRDVLRYLFRERSVPFDDLVDQIVSQELDRRVEEVDPDHRSAVYASLYQTHVPKLADADVVVYDPERRQVTLTDRGRQLRWYLDGPRNGNFGWGWAFLAGSLLWTTVAIAVQQEVPLVSAVPEPWLPVGVLCTFIGLSLGYMRWAHNGGSLSDRAGRSPGSE